METLTNTARTMTVSADWLNVSNTTRWWTNTTLTTYPTYPPYTTWVTWPDDRPRIRLALSEVERLREAARKDKKLKSILKKFTDHIEVYVDFD